jgi:hypothetical protein
MLTCRGCTLHQGMAHVPADAEREHTRPSDLKLPLHGRDDGVRVAHLAIRQQEDLWYRVTGSTKSKTAQRPILVIRFLRNLAEKEEQEAER